jgi:hypothetical protein
MQCRIVRLLPPTEGVLEITGGDQEGRVGTMCSEADGGTRVEQTLEYKVPGGLKGKLMSAVTGPMLQREMKHALGRLKETLEREAGGVDGSRTA